MAREISPELEGAPSGGLVKWEQLEWEEKVRVGVECFKGESRTHQ